MNVMQSLKMAGAVAAVSVCMAMPAQAVTVLNDGDVNAITINDVFVYDSAFGLDAGDTVDLEFGFTATEDLATIETTTVNPAFESIADLTLSWYSGPGATGTLFNSLVFTTGLGTVIDSTASLLMTFTTGQTAYLSVTGSVLKDSTDLDLRIEAVPVPPALLLFGSGIAGLGMLARRRKNKEGVAAIA